VHLHLYRSTIETTEAILAGRGNRPGRLSGEMSPTWIWTQIAIVVFVVIGMIVAITKLA
jgi:hypothetical protein